MEVNYSSNLSSLNVEIKPYIFPNENDPYIIEKQFSLFLDKYQTFNSKQDKYNFSIIVNAWHILINNLNLFNNLFTYLESDTASMSSVPSSKVYINLHSNGKLKQIHFSKKSIDNLFTSLYLTYTKYIHYYYSTSNRLFTINEVLFDISGYPIYEYDLSSKVIQDYLKIQLKSIIDNSPNENSILLLINDRDNSLQSLNQFSFEIISTFVYKKETVYKVKLLQMLNSSLISKYDYINLIDNKNMSNIDIARFYPIEIEPFISSKYYTYLSYEDIISKFNRMIEIKKYQYSNKINGKFIKVTRNDNVTEYISRWFYTFNIGNDNTEVCIGIHNIDLIEKKYDLTFTGIIILKSNMMNFSFVDYVQVKNQRDNYLKCFLSKGSFLIIPICVYNFNREHKKKNNIKSIPLIIEDKNKKKALTTYCMCCIEEIFERFDIDKDGNMTQGEVDLFLDYIKDKVTDYSIIDKILPKGSIKCNIFKKLFYEMAINEKENDIYEILTLFGYGNIYNYSTRLFYLTFDSMVCIEMKIADALTFPINSYSYELLIKQLGTEMKIEETGSIILYYFQINTEILLLMIENMTGKTKDIKFTIKKMEYKTQLNAYEKQYLFPYFIQNNDLNLDFQLYVE